MSDISPGESLHYALIDTPLDRLLLAASSVGICALFFGTDSAYLLDDLQKRFPKAQLIEDRPRLHKWLVALQDYLQQTAALPELPLDRRGTAFQQRVWHALQEIPLGETRRYAELASQLGSHARAVASACARNPVSLLVPCHRVIGANQQLTGYRWGLERKAWLLAFEQGLNNATKPLDIS